MWWQDLFWGFWNGLTAWVVFIVHVFGGWPEYPFYDLARGGNWYDFGFLIGAGSPILGALSTGRRTVYIREKRKVINDEESRPEIRV
jgi:hypothetical protein